MKYVCSLIIGEISKIINSPNNFMIKSIELIENIVR